MLASLVNLRVQHYTVYFAFSELCVEGSVRLTGGNTDRDGWVEVCDKETWQSVCDDGWGNVQAEVVCRELGFPTQGQVY